jgi:hypothetical protein
LERYCGANIIQLPAIAGNGWNNVNPEVSDKPSRSKQDKLLSSLRWTTSEDEYLAKMRKMFWPKL